MNNMKNINNINNMNNINNNKNKNKNKRNISNYKGKGGSQPERSCFGVLGSRCALPLFRFFFSLAFFCFFALVQRP
jgi:hypothetical protein